MKARELLARGGALALLCVLVGCGGAELPRRMVGGWQQLLHQTYSRRALYAQLLGVDGGIADEFPLARVEDYVYGHARSGVRVGIRAYYFNSGDDAYGMFTQLAPDAPEWLDVGEKAYRADTVLIVRRGNVLLRLEPTAGGISEEALAALAEEVCAHLPGGSSPLLVTSIPRFLGDAGDARKIVPRFGHGDASAARWIDAPLRAALGLSARTTYVCTWFVANGTPTTLLLVDYPDSAQAQHVRTNAAAFLARRTPSARVWGESTSVALMYAHAPPR